MQTPRALPQVRGSWEVRGEVVGEACTTEAGKRNRKS